MKFWRYKQVDDESMTVDRPIVNMIILISLWDKFKKIVTEAIFSTAVIALFIIIKYHNIDNINSVSSFITVGMFT